MSKVTKDMTKFQVGTYVRVASDNAYDYGHYLGKVGVIIGGGAVHSNGRRYLVKFDKDEIHVFSLDLELA